MNATPRTVRAILQLLAGLQMRLPALPSLSINTGKLLVELRPADYVDARIWLDALGGTAEPDRIVWAESGAVWWHADVTVNGWTIHVDAREQLHHSVPLHSTTDADLDDSCDALLDAFEILAWNRLMDKAREAREWALAQHAATSCDGSTDRSTDSSDVMAAVERAASAGLLGDDYLPEDLAHETADAAELILDRAIPGRGSD